MQEKTTITDNTTLCLGFLTNRVGRLLAIHLKTKLGKEEFDMPSHCLGILADLWEQDGVIQQDLAIAIVKDKATIARALDLMEKKNIIVRVKDEKDRRNKKIFLTHKGKQLHSKVMLQGDGLLENVKKGISDTEMKSCLNTLDKIYHNLKEKL